MYQCLFKSYLAFFKPEGLLAAAGWGGAAERNYQRFWHERMSVEVDPELVALVYAFLAREREVGSCFAIVLASVMPIVSLHHLLQGCSLISVQNAAQANFWMIAVVQAAIVKCFA